MCMRALKFQIYGIGFTLTFRDQMLYLQMLYFQNSHLVHAAMQPQVITSLMRMHRHTMQHTLHSTHSAYSHQLSRWGKRSRSLTLRLSLSGGSIVAGLLRALLASISTSFSCVKGPKVLLVPWHGLSVGEFLACFCCPGTAWRWH